MCERCHGMSGDCDACVSGWLVDNVTRSCTEEGSVGDGDPCSDSRACESANCFAFEVCLPWSTFRDAATGRCVPCRTECPTGFGMGCGCNSTHDSQCVDQGSAIQSQLSCSSDAATGVCCPVGATTDCSLPQSLGSAGGETRAAMGVGWAALLAVLLLLLAAGLAVWGFRRRQQKQFIHFGDRIELPAARLDGYNGVLENPVYSPIAAVLSAARTDEMEADRPTPIYASLDATTAYCLSGGSSSIAGVSSTMVGAYNVLHAVDSTSSASGAVELYIVPLDGAPTAPGADVTYAIPMHDLGGGSETIENDMYVCADATPGRTPATASPDGPAVTYSVPFARVGQVCAEGKAADAKGATEVRGYAMAKGAAGGLGAASTLAANVVYAVPREGQAGTAYIDVEPSTFQDGQARTGQVYLEVEASSLADRLPSERSAGHGVIHDRMPQSAVRRTPVQTGMAVDATTV